MLFNRPKPFSLTIDNPCLQSWDDMQMAGDGKFCAHCSKTVVDFTQMSDAALFDYLKKNGLGCGRFLDTQLNRMVVPPVVPKRKFWPQLLLSIGLFLGLVKESNAQETRPGYEIVQTEIKPDTANKKEERMNGDFIVKGTVTDEMGNPLPSAQVTIREAGVSIAGALTDFDGLYNTIIPISKLQQSIDIVVKWQNLEESRNFLLQEQNIDVNIRMNTQKLNNAKTRFVVGGPMVCRLPPLINPKEPTRRTKTIE